MDRTLRTRAASPCDVGDTAAWIERARPRLTKEASNRTGSRDDADDFFGDAACRVLCQADALQFATEEALRSYLRKAITGQACKRLRRTAIVPLEEVTEIADSCPGPAEHLLRRELLQAIRQAFARLPVDVQRLISYHLDGLSWNEVASRCGFKSATARQKYRRGLLEMRRQLRAWEE